MKLSKFKFNNITILFLVLILVMFIMSLVTEYFLTVDYILNSLRFVAESGLIALGMSLVILIGGIDLSVGSAVALSAVSLGMLLKAGVSEPAAVFLALLVGVLCGFFNGLIISKINIPPIIVTLATMAVYRGLAIGITAGNAYKISESLYFIGQSNILGIPFQFIVFVLALVCIAFCIHRTNMGENLKAIGYNCESAMFSGLRINKEKIRVYILSGLFSALAGIIFACRVSSSKADYGTGYELDAITVVVFGGASLAGGKISILGTFLATVIIVFLRLGLTTAIVPTEVQSILIGLILIVSVSVNKYLENRKAVRRQSK